MATDPKTFISNTALEYYDGNFLINSVEGSTPGLITLTQNPVGLIRLTGLEDPITDPDAATKGYVDNISAGLIWIQEAMAGTTANVDLGTDLAVGQVVDGYTIQNGDRILVLHQTNPVENGVYIAGGTRAPDMANGSSMDHITLTVIEGTVNKNTTFVTTTNGTVGTDPVEFTRFGSGHAPVPGGTNGQIQYNDNMQFAGTSTLSYDGTNLTSTGASIIFGTNNITEETGNLLIENTNAGGKLLLRLGDSNPNSEVIFQDGSGTGKMFFAASGSATIPNLTVDGSGFAGTILEVQGDAEIQDEFTVGDISTLNGTVTCASDLIVQDTTDSTSITTGAVKVAGGAGIEKNAFVGGNADIAGTTTSGGVLTVTDSTPTTAPTDGALVVGGGVGISGDVRATGTIYSTGVRQESDRRVKQDVKDLQNCSELLEKVPAYEYKYKTGNGLKRFGVMAQDLQEIPELEDFVEANDGGKMTVDYMNFIALLIGGHKEMSSKIKDLEAQIKAMQSIN